MGETLESRIGLAETRLFLVSDRSRSDSSHLIAHLETSVQCYHTGKLSDRETLLSLDDDEVFPAGGQLVGLWQDLVGEGVLGGLGHVEVLEGVELPHACGGGVGEQEVAFQLKVKPVL